MMKLTDLSTIREIMTRHGVEFQKKFGQNFLISPAVPQKIADAAVESDSNTDQLRGILEIGPGIGTLTRELAERADKVIALEIDSSLIPILSETLADCPNVKVINQDVMKTDLAALCADEFISQGYSVSVAANLPYYITTPILMKLVESKLPLNTITVMIQKEVAARLCAPAGNSEYGAITASLSYYGKVERLFNVPAGCFLPAPKVDSTVIRIRLYDTPPVSVESEACLFRTIRGAFAQRRKTLANSLMTEFTQLGREAVQNAIVSAGLEPSVRGERLTLDDFARLADILYKCEIENN
ncbi:MAG: 16S rRNA (adenine(1518)-N(6)/adenine(1519)-N(6))-dimethyltransferase RsmA [Clostridiales bacterium]|nr:16S rRNA (adenine(1518)-N(6)/adenine(1519)-N(6))-dimethyltransferase RsmA [Clostridiales bacterium]